MNKINSLDYGVAVGAVRVLESKLIKLEEFSKLELCKNLKDFVLELKNLNYSVVDFFNFSDFGLKLNNMFIEIFFELKKLCPKGAPFNFISFNNDCFNLKAALVAKNHMTDCDNYILKPGLLSVDLIELCVLEENFKMLPEPFSSLANSLYDMFKLNVSSFDVFNEFIKKVFEAKLGLFSWSCFFSQRVKLEIDLYNCRLILKALRLNFDETILKKVLIDGGTVNSVLIIKAFCGGIESLKKFFKLNWGFNLEDILNYSEIVDEILFKKVFDFDSKICNLPFSFASIVSYLNRLQHEHKNLKKILTKLSYLGG